MWIRSDLKMAAKAALKGRYWTAFGVCVIVSIINGIPNSISNSGSNITTTFSLQGISPALLQVLLITGMIIALVGLGISILLTNHLSVGLAKFFLNNREGRGNISDIFFAFKEGRYGNVFGVMFMRGLFIFLWSLLFVIPGVIKAYQYYLVPYIVAENPEINYKDALALSKERMEGHKLNVWVLELSFIGWDLLGLLACCIGSWFVRPYKEATYAELYCALMPTPPMIDGEPESGYYQNPSDFNY